MAENYNAQLHRLDLYEPMRLVQADRIAERWQRCLPEKQLTLARTIRNVR